MELTSASFQVADGLVKVQVALGNIASKRERVKILYKKSKCFCQVSDYTASHVCPWKPVPACQPVCPKKSPLRIEGVLLLMW